jgi:hypothetical protein
MENHDDEIVLNDIWNIYFHDPIDTDWTMPSYKLLASVSSVQEYWKAMYAPLQDKIHKGIFFVMREYVFPCWDDANNIDGGCLSIKILKEQLPAFWDDLCIKLLGETLLKENMRHHWNLVNGISTSPKKHFCIIKIWLRDEVLASKEHFNLLSNYHGDIFYKSNRENIHQDSNAAVVSNASNAH